MKDLLKNNEKSDIDWRNEIKNYKSWKNNTIDWKKIRQNDIITTEKVKKNDVYYNPILQKYNNINLDSQISQKEKNDIINSIVKRKDYQLSKEQTYNLVNLQDKLKGFENHPDYPKPKNIMRKKIIYHPKNFNILSNLPLNLHHYDKPENRPNLTTENQSKSHRTLTNIGHYKDYDIISNRYKHFNDEKIKIDKEINKINTARIFFKKNDYNPIKGSYFNEEKEKNFLKKRSEEQLEWGKEKIQNLPKCAKGKSDVYNLITTKVVDPVEMDRIIKEEKEKKKRYGLRYQLEKYYRERSLSKNSQDEERSNNKESFERYRIEEQRQYNIINLKEKPFNKHSKNIKKGSQTIWERILIGANNNNTFENKEIYRDPYDYSETRKFFDEYKIRRNKTLSKLKKIEDDDLFNKRKKNFPKIKLKKFLKLNENEICKTSNNFMDKSKFFGSS